MEHVEELDSILAFWESVEFYAAGTVVDKMFSKQELAEIREAIVSKFDGPKQKRLEQAIGSVNDAHLLTRLRRALADDGVPYTESEFSLVSRMRKARNYYLTLITRWGLTRSRFVDLRVCSRGWRDWGTRRAF